MKYTLSARAASLQPSATLALNAKAKQLAAEGKDIINLSVGEPDFDTPEHIKEAARRAIQEGQTKYTAVEGTPALRQAIAQKLKRDNGLDYKPQQIIASTGAKQAIFNLCLALLNPGDEVIMGAPYWVSYADIVGFCEAKSVIIQTRMEDEFCITAAQLEAAITPKTKMLFLNSPCNPTGTAYSKKRLQALADVLLKHPSVFIMSDDIYEHIWWSSEPFYNIVMVCHALYERTIIINGVSKTYAMTGWRMGYAAGATPIIDAMSKIQSQSTSNPCSITQAATIAALDGDQTCVQEMKAAFYRRYQLVSQALSKIKDLQLPACSGAFYVYPRVQDIIDQCPQIADDGALSMYLLEHAGLALTPGLAFGTPGYLRISYALSDAVLLQMTQRLQKAITQLLAS